MAGEVAGEPGDYAAQTGQVIANCLAVLAAAGAAPASTLLGVAALGYQANSSRST